MTPATVLVVDDDPAQLTQARLRLGEQGFDVTTASDGVEALEKARASPPDAILADVLMPRMNGFRLCHAVRHDPRLARVPVVLLSCRYVEEADARLARQVGASAFLLRKPGLQGVAEALIESFAAGPPAAATDRDEGLEAEYLERVARQLERLADSQKQHEARARQQAAVARLGQRALARTDRQTLMNEAVALVAETLGVEYAKVLELLPDGREFLLRAGVGWREGLVGHALVSSGSDSQAGYTLRSHGPVVVNDLRTEARFDGPPLLRDHPVVSGLSVLIEGLERPYGVLGAHTTAQRDFGEDDVHFLESVAHVIATAIEREETQERLRLVLDSTAEAIVEVDLEGKCTFANAACLRLLGYASPQALGGRGIHGLIHHTRPDGSPYPEEACRVYEALRRGEGVHVDDEVLWRADGTCFPAEYWSYPVRREGVIVGSVMTFLDITERRRAEEATLKERALSEAMMNSLPGIFYLFDQAGRFLRWNKDFERVSGYASAEIATMSPLDFFLGRDRKLIQERIGQVFATGAADAEANLVSKKGMHTPHYFVGARVMVDGRPCCTGMGIDLTERKRLEAQLLQSQKMEAVGRLAGGVAHDFNNLLNVIEGHSELLLKEIGPEHPGRRRLGQVLKAVERAAALTRQLLAFSRKQVLQPRPLDLNAVLAEIEKMLRRLIGEDIQLVTVFEQALGRVLADPGQMEQVIVNLALNARDAMPKGGRLILETANVELDEAYLRSHAGARPGPHVMLAVSDTGHGMDAETLSHIFEPFFTTKEPGKGTGLGLATVYGIVQQSGGHVNVYSESGRGSTFKVYLPRVEGEAGTMPAAEAAAEPEAPGGSETILLAEDEESLRLMIQEILEAAGYTVLAGARPEEVWSVARSHAGPIHLVLTDVVMPGMSGRELAAQLEAVRPGVRVLYMSGYTDEAISHHGVLEPGTHFIQKPFVSDSLLRKLREVLDAL